MLFFLLLVALEPVTAGVPCCLDRQFEVTMGEVGGSVFTRNGTARHALINSLNRVHFDFYSHKMAIEAMVTSSTGVKTETDILVDLDTHSTYITNHGHCIKMGRGIGIPLFKPCIPQNATKVEESHVGFGSYKIPFTTWQFILQPTGQLVRLSVTDVGCIPMFESVFGTIARGSTDAVFIMSNFRPGIANPNVFNTPSNCSTVPSPNDLPDHAQHAYKLLKRFTGGS